MGVEEWRVRMGVDGGGWGNNVIILQFSSKSLDDYISGDEPLRRGRSAAAAALGRISVVVSGCRPAGVGTVAPRASLSGS